ncbi:MAG: hypothetical protein KatS3mg105_1963 [Gemmatales bacterium]|nr:MAG: hypothetical protein KatS3mg105_1963 [Gemmatales bacterium]
MLANSRLLLCSDAPESFADVCTELRAQGVEVEVRSLEATSADGDYRAIIVDARHQPEAAIRFCRHLRPDTSSSPPLLVVATRDRAVADLDHQTGADAFLTQPVQVHDLLKQIDWAGRLRDLRGKVVGKTDEIHRLSRKLQVCFERYQREIELAERMQQRLQRAALTEMEFSGCQFVVHLTASRGCARVFRLDETRVGFFAACSLREGMTGALVPLFLHSVLDTRETNGNTFRIRGPEEVLALLNDDFVAIGCAGEPVLTIQYGTIDLISRKLHFARSGGAMPLHIPLNGPVTTCSAAGPLIGVGPGAFTVPCLPLQPGDKMLFVVDRLETGNHDLQDRVERLRHLPVVELVKQIAAQPNTGPATLAGLEIAVAK